MFFANCKFPKQHLWSEQKLKIAGRLHDFSTSYAPTCVLLFYLLFSWILLKNLKK